MITDMKGKRRLYSWVLLLVLFAPVAVSISWLQVQKTVLKKQVKQQLISRLSDEQLVLIKLSKADAAIQLKWEHSKEFEYKEHMYDIVCSYSEGDTVYYRCFPDEKETQLNRQLEKLVSKATESDTGQRQTNNLLHSFLKSLYFNNSNCNCFLRECTYVNYSIASEGPENILHPQPPVPPPKST